MAISLLLWLNEIAQSCIRFISLQLLLSTLVFAFIWFISHIFHRKSLRLHYMLWSLVLLRLASPPTFTWKYNLSRFFNPSISSGLSMNNPADGSQSVKPIRSTGDGSENPPVNYPGKTTIEGSANRSSIRSWTEVNKNMHWTDTILFTLWVIGFMIVISSFLKRMRCFGHAARSGTLEKEAVQSLCNRWRQRLAIHNPVPVYTSHSITTPCATGVINPKIILPSGLLNSFHRDELETIIVHELIHIKRRDMLFTRLRNLVGFIYFFHPVFWIANSKLQQLQEEACDETVLGFSGMTAQRYSEVMLRVLREDYFEMNRRLIPSLAFGNPKLKFIRRIQKMQTHGKADRFHLGHVTIILLAIVIAFSCGFTAEKRSKLEGITGNGVKTESTETSANLYSKKLEPLYEKIQEGNYGNVTSLLITQNGELLVEKYFGDMKRETLQPIAGISKSFTSALIGIAMEQGKIKSLDEPIMNFFPAYRDIAYMGSIKRQITLRHLLSMTPGFTWDETTYPYGYPQNEFQKMAMSPDWVKYALSAPVQDIPGATFIYNSGCTIILSGILSNVTGQSAEEYAKDYLFTPMEITNADWKFEIAPNGLTQTSGGLAMRPLDVLKFGQLFLNGGVWNGKPLVPRDWVIASTQKQTSAGINNDYGFHWWRYSGSHQAVRHVKTKDIFFARGATGQFLWVVPHMKLIVVSTASNYRNPYRSEAMLWEYILPAFNNV